MFQLSFGRMVTQILYYLSARVEMSTLRGTTGVGYAGPPQDISGLVKFSLPQACNISLSCRRTTSSRRSLLL
jgi:hypothetical protein